VKWLTGSEESGEAERSNTGGKNVSSVVVRGHAAFRRASSLKALPYVYRSADGGACAAGGQVEMMGGEIEEQGSGSGERCAEMPKEEMERGYSASLQGVGESDAAEASGVSGARGAGHVLRMLKILSCCGSNKHITAPISAVAPQRSAVAGTVFAQEHVVSSRAPSIQSTATEADKRGELTEGVREVLVEVEGEVDDAVAAVSREASGIDMSRGRTWLAVSDCQLTDYELTGEGEGNSCVGDEIAAVVKWLTGSEESGEAERSNTGGKNVSSVVVRGHAALRQQGVEESDAAEASGVSGARWAGHVLRMLKILSCCGSNKHITAPISAVAPQRSAVAGTVFAQEHVVSSRAPSVQSTATEADKRGELTEGVREVLVEVEGEVDDAVAAVGMEATGMKADPRSGSVFFEGKSGVYRRALSLKPLPYPAAGL
jgi:hypothetical protein